MARLASRIPMAVVIGLAAATTLGAALAASAGDAVQDLVFHIPAARIGDEASYSAALTGDWLLDGRAQGEAFPFLTLGWFPAEELRDEDGALRPADVVRVQGLTYAPWNWVDDGGGKVVQGPAWLAHHHALWFEPATTRMLAIGGDYDHSTSEPMLGTVAAAPLLSQRLHDEVAIRLYPDSVHVAHCLAADELQGRVLRVGDVIDLPTCPIDNLDHWRPAGRFTAVAVERVVGVDALRVEGENVTMWWASGLAFPVRYQASQAISIDHNNNPGIGGFLLELTGLVPGTQARGDERAPGPLPTPLDTAPPSPWGMDEAGIEHPFPASQAFQEATQKSALFAALLQRSPDAYLATAYEHSLDYSDDAQPRWWLTLTDGKDAVEVEIGQETSPAGTGPMLGVVPRAWPHASATATVTLHAERQVDGSHYPLPARVPKDWPTVTGVAQRWHLYAGDATDALPVSGWGHTIRCAGPDCKAPTLHVGVAHLSIDRDPAAVDTTTEAPVVVDPATKRMSIFSMNASSQRATGFHQSVADGGLAADLDGGGPPPSAAADQPRPVDGLLLAGLWSPPQAAGVGALALGLAAGYWLWPVIKSGGVAGLFSRLRHDRLLDHPLRARIVEAVAADPGVHFSALLRRTGIPNGSLYHHLQVLRKAGRLDAIANQGYTCYFPVGGSAVTQRSASASKADGAQRILAKVRATPGLSVKQMAIECGLQTSTVSYHVQRLSDAGVVDALRDGREVRLRMRAEA